ncbi:retrovirus-related Pol polyprotein from transposon opus [Trichonephila clavipes]|nr:retrovirus-related Pol polyprotein from transposon opus [Trichonephila clavipes]
MAEEKLIDHIISRLEPQILDYVEIRNPQATSNLLQIIDKYEVRFLNRKIRGSSWESRDIKSNENNRFPNRNRQENRRETSERETRGNNRYADNSRPRREINRFESQGVADNQRFDGRRRGGQSDHRFHNQGGSRNSAFGDQPGLTHVLCHEIDTGDKGPVVSRPYRYDRVKQEIIDYHIEKMLQEGAIRPIQSPYASPAVLTRKNNGLPPNSSEAYRFANDYRKLNAITKYPRYPLPVIDDLITNIPHTGVMSTLDLKSGYFQLAISPKDIEKTAFITRNGTFAFLRMAFDLSGAAPNFQKAIDVGIYG